MNFFRKKRQPSEFEAEVFGHINSLYQSALYMTRNDRDAEDLVQETVLKAFRFFDKFEKGTNIRAWLFKILHNTFINMYRKKTRSIEIVDAFDFSEREERFSFEFPEGDSSNPEDIMSNRMLSEKIESSLSELPSEFKMAVILCDMEGFSYKEIAEIMDCPVGTVMSRIFRGRKFLQTKLVRHAKEQGLIVESPDQRTEEKPISLSEYRNKSIN